MSGSKNMAALVPRLATTRAAEAGTGTVTGTAFPVVCRSGQGIALVPVLPSLGQGTSMADDWPLRSYMELGALPGAVPCARLHTRQLLWEWGFTEVGDTVELLVSELITNAMHATWAIKRDLPIRFWLLSDKTRLIISVWDGNHRSPKPKDPSTEAESGRGLVLVDVLSDNWDWYAHKSFGGKIVWCEISLNPALNTSG